MTIAAKDFKIKKSYSALIKRAIVEHLTRELYQPIFDMADIALVASNSKTDDEAIRDALKAGIIYYDERGFSAKNKFSNKIATILEKWGATYDRFRKVYKLSKDKIPETIRVTLAKIKIEYSQKIAAIDNFLKVFEANIDKHIENMIFNTEVKTILDDAGKELSKNVKRINVIEIELTDEQKKEIAKNYTNNMDYYIKDFERDRIPKMRKRIQELTLEGLRPDAISQMLQKEFGIMQKKADFLAQNETSIMLSEVKKVQYQEMGSIGFIWDTIVDGKERERHKELNGKFFRWDDLPEIDEKGTRGLPGQTYNCRCGLTPVFEDNPFTNNTGRFDPVDPLKYTNPTQRKKLEEETKKQ